VSNDYSISRVEGLKVDVEAMENPIDLPSCAFSITSTGECRAWSVVGIGTSELADVSD